MKTDTEIKKEVRAERHRVFWRLHSLPWILVVLFLIGFNFYRIYESDKGVKEFRLAKEEFQKARDASFREGLSQGKREVRSEALLKGYGEFQVSSDYEIIFKWIDIVEPEIFNEEIEILPKGQTLPRRQEQDSYVAGLLEYQTSQKLGIDLEKELLKGVNEKLNGIIKTIGIEMTDEERAILIRILSVNLESSIRTKFEGFRTYHGLR